MFRVGASIAHVAFYGFCVGLVTAGYPYHLPVRSAGQHERWRARSGISHGKPCHTDERHFRLSS